MAIALAKALDGKKGQDIKVLKTEELTTLADYFVLCTATSSTQVKAMSDADGFLIRCGPCVYRRSSKVL